MIPNPNIQKAIEPTAKSIRFFIKTLTTFLARTKPASSIAKPGCIKKTRNAESKVHTVSNAFALDSAKELAAKPLLSKRKKIRRIKRVNLPIFVDSSVSNKKCFQ